MVLLKVYCCMIDELVFDNGSFENIDKLRATVARSILDCAATGQTGAAQIAYCANAQVKPLVRAGGELRPAPRKQEPVPRTNLN